MERGLLERVLVPLDGSLNAEAILTHLRRVVPRNNAEIILVQAIPFGPLGDEAEARKYLRRISFKLINDGYPARSVVRPGLAADVILDTALEERASLIALTTQGRTGATRWVLGSVAEKVAQASTLPVLVSRPLSATLSRGALEALPIRKFLVPLDGSRRALEALKVVLELARSVDAHVILLHVAEPSPFDGRWPETDETMQVADRILREACVPAAIEHRKGDPGQEIVRFAEKAGIDLIAMTTHGRTGPSRWVFGSVTSKVLRAAPLPLLVVHSPDRRPAPALSDPHTAQIEPGE